MVDLRSVRNLYVLCSLLLLAACSNGRGSVDSEQPPPSGGAQSGFTVSGTVAGLDGDGMVLQLNGANDLAVANNGTFTFSAQLTNTTAYSVTVLTQPSGPSQTCTIGNSSGTIAAANVTNVAVTCATGAFALGGTVSGLAGTGLVLQNNGGDDLAIATGASDFSFPSPIASGAVYSITVKTQPSGPAQSCSVANGAGTIGSADVTNVAVTCATGSFTVGGTVTGLQGPGLVLKNNGGDDLTIVGNGPFQFPAMLASGATYNVSVARNPSNPAQNCGITNPTGTINGASVANITVTCMTNRFTVGGSISGLAGSKLELRLNNEPPLELSAPAPTFTFGALLQSGTQYVVQVTRNPSNPAQDCKITAGERGAIGSANVTNVAVTCTTASFSIGGSVQGLQGKDLVLQKNGGDDRRIASDGEYTFQTKQASGTRYAVKVSSPPVSPSQTCTIANADGTVGDGDIQNVDVTCAINTFKIGGSVSGLLGSGLVLMNNGGDDLPVPGNGSFQFTTPVASGANYNVDVRRQPINPTQACTVGSPSGTVGNGDVATVVVSCSTSDFTVGGSISRLAGSGLVLQINGGSDLRLDSGAVSFTFPPIPSGTPYNVTVAAQPTGPAQLCTVIANPSGTIGGANVTNVEVDCVTTEFTIGGTVTGLHGIGLQLQNNGGEVLSIAADGPFTFPTSLPNNTAYSVIVVTQPNTPTQACLATNNVGIVSGANVTTIVVECVDSP